MSTYEHIYILSELTSKPLSFTQSKTQRGAKDNPEMWL